MEFTTAIIGGTGLTHPDRFTFIREEYVETPFGHPSGALQFGTLFGKPVVFLARHGNPHVIPPHKVNYRANLWALKSVGIREVVAVAAVGGITADMGPEVLAIPDQIIDYTYGRHQTFHEENLTEVVHIDFTEPYTETLRQALISAAATAGIPTVTQGVYGCTQGPRLETPAEIRRMEQDGCDLVGMTGMPEACLARELELDYACFAVVANWAAGKQAGEITMDEIHAHLDVGMAKLFAVLRQWLRV